MSLSTHQESVMHEGLEILDNSKRLLIKGSAGVGKTYMVNELIKQLAIKIPKYKEIYCSAPTNKAVAVLAGKIDLEADELKGRKVSLITTHSALKISKYTDEKTGNVSFRPQISEKYPPLKGVALFIIDEASMIGEEMLGWIEDHATRNNTTVIFIGDDKQLNPVGEEESPVFIKNYPFVELTEIVRQGDGNPIIGLSRNLSAIWQYRGRVTEDKKGFVYTTDNEKVVQELANVNGSDELKYIAWTNKEVDEMNSLVRSRIYNNPAKIELGESLIFDEPYMEYYTNQEIKVNTLDVDEVEFAVVTQENPETSVSFVKLKCYIINGKKVDEWGDGNLVWKGVFVIHEDAEEQFENLSKLLKINCAKRHKGSNMLKWATRNNFLGKFAKVKYNHAISIHKSQGSTFKQVIMNVQNVNLNSNQKEKNRLFYTGVTRASDLLILYNV